MNKSDVFKAILEGATALIPGGPAVKEGIEALTHRNSDPTDDVDEIADAITKIAMGSVAAAEGLTDHDIVNDPVLAQLAANIKGDLKLAQLVIVRKAAA
jgi:hypothetical protein